MRVRGKGNKIRCLPLASDTVLLLDLNTVGGFFRHDASRYCTQNSIPLGRRTTRLFVRERLQTPKSAFGLYKKTGGTPLLLEANVRIEGSNLEKRSN